MLGSVGEFTRYFGGVRRRTWAAVDRVSPELLDWAPRPGEMTCGAIVRHVAGAERFFVTKVMDSVHRAQMGRLAGLPDEALRAPRRDLDGGTVKAGRFLMAMVEHEVHHRSQLDCYLAEAGVEPPQVYGWRMEDVMARVARDGGA
jgi:uncharacterized damage-inducible protein DinB